LSDSSAEATSPGTFAGTPEIERRLGERQRERELRAGAQPEPVPLELGRASLTRRACATVTCSPR
jgi:hypothetical protein